LGVLVDRQVGDECAQNARVDQAVSFGLAGIVDVSTAASSEFGKDQPSLSTSVETLTIEDSMTLRARTENVGHGDEHEWSWAGG
jgi:hypothetical protein